MPRAGGGLRNVMAYAAILSACTLAILTLLVAGAFLFTPVFSAGPAKPSPAPAASPQASPSPHTTALYATDYRAGTLLALSPRGPLLATYTVGPSPTAVALSPDGSTAYVLTSSALAIVALDGSRDTYSIALPSPTRGLALDAQGSRAYTLAVEAGTLIPIDLAAGKALAPVSVGTAPYALALSPDRNYVYIASLYASTLTPVRVARNGGPHRAILPAPQVLPALPAIAAPTAVAISPDGTTAYVTGSSTAALAAIPLDGSKAKTFPAGQTPVSIALSPDGSTAYVVDYGSSEVTALDTATGTVKGTIPTGTAPYAISLDPASHAAYVACYGSHTVTAFSTSSLKPGLAIPAGSSPLAVAAG